MARRDDGSGARRRRWPWVLLAFAVLVVVLIGLALLAKPLLQVKPEAEAARDDLAAAEDALRAEDLDAASAHIASARVHVDEASQRVNGFGGDVWRWVPVAGGAIKDVRHLVSALDQATSLADIGVELYPDVMQSDNLVTNGNVDLAALSHILDGINRAGEHLHAAADDLDAVKGSTPFVGDSVAAARDQAKARVDPLEKTYDDAAPVLEALPSVLGQAGERTYLVAMMNPAELRYSGGATLTFATLTMKNGDATFGSPVTNEDISAGTEKIAWPRVKGNPFHRPGKTRVLNATFSPYWSQSGEELLRAWEVRYGVKCDGVIAVDLQALARLMSLTGPVQVPIIGEVNAGNLVQLLAGSYDTYDTPDERQAINAALVPAFREKLFEGGQFTKKLQVLADAAKGRHFALYFRDSRLQKAFVERDLDGDLSDTGNDYLGVFTQNTNGSKSDYWQNRKVESDVTLNADGSADVALTVTVMNPSPPWVHADFPDPSQDPRTGYYTRWAGNSIAVFMPRGAELTGQARIGNLKFRPFVREVLGRPYISRKVLLRPQGERVLTVSYHVPSAATVDGNKMTYRLAIDPQATVVPETVDVTLHLPDGYALTNAPTDWVPVDGSTVRLEVPALDDSPSWAVHFAKS